MLIATENLKEQAIEKSGIENLFETSLWYNFAYTDYGGYFWDKVCIRYFAENYPDNFVHEVSGWSGENGILFNTSENTNLVEDFCEATENYLLGFGDLEHYYSELEFKQTVESFENFLEDTKIDFFVKSETLDYLIDNYMGYFSMLANDLDFCAFDMQKHLREKNLIFKRYGNEFFEDLLVIFEDIQLETELSKENNTLFESIYNLYYPGKYSNEDIKSIEDFFGCTFYLHDNGDFCVNWKN